MILIDDLIAALNAEPEDEVYLVQLLAAAVEYINEPGGRYFGLVKEITDNITWRGGTFRLSNDPIGAVEFSRNSGSGWEDESADNYLVDGRLVYLLNSFSLRSTATWPVHLRATYNAGYAHVEGGEYDEDTWAAPEDIKQAVRMLVGHWFMNREAAVSGTVSNEVQLGVAMVLNKYR